MAGAHFRRNFMANKIKADLNSRFSLSNKSLAVRGNYKKLFDELRNAHWYYLDFYCQQPGTIQNDDANVLPIAFEDFCEEMLRYIPEWKSIHIKWRQLYESWRQQTSKAIRCGAIILDQTSSYVLLVKGFFRDGYQFPAGKKDNDGEPYETCAIRELEEETGFDISKLIRPSLFFERKISNCLRRYYLITGVNPDQLTLRPSSRNEIKMILWMKVDDLPEDNEGAKLLGHSPRDFFLCIPWAKQLKSFCRHLRDGELPFKALHMCECVSDDTDDTNDNQGSSKFSMSVRHTTNGKRSEIDTYIENHANSSESDLGENRPNQTSNHSKSPSVCSFSSERGKNRRRCDRRKNRVSNISNEINSQTNSEKILYRIPTKEASRRSKTQKGKSSNCSSDSGYSDQSDQTSVQVDDIGCSPINDDFLMTQAILALKQISPIRS